MTTERKTIRERIPGTEDTVTVVRTRIGHVSIYYTAYDGNVQQETRRAFNVRNLRDRFVAKLLDRLDDLPVTDRPFTHVELDEIEAEARRYDGQPVPIGLPSHGMVKRLVAQARRAIGPIPGSGFYHAPGCNTLSRGCVQGCDNYSKEFDED